MQKLNPEHVESVLSMINKSPYFDLLSIVVKDIGIGYSYIEMDIEKKHLNPFKGIHGGVYSSIIDTAAYWAVYSEMPEGSGLITLDLTVNNLAPVKSGTLVVKGKRIKTGRTICIAEAGVMQGERVVSHGISKMVVTKGLQTIDQILEEKPICIPPKFLQIN